tara:strand:+ start:2487 stop:2636 length:150 start_codon:yes stop_codon:yes gene_type:complete
MMADNDCLKIDKITQMPVHEFHIALAHRLDRQKMEASLRTSKGGNVTEL